MTQSIVPWIQRKKKPKFITLTLKHSNAPLGEQIDGLYKFFSKLRRRPFWKKKIGGGVWFFQVKKSKNDNLWHPHLHILASGLYIAQRDLSRQWAHITHGSTIVDIRAVRNPEKAAEYVARYASAPCDPSGLDFEAALELIEAMHGRRICGTFGNGKEIQLVPKKCPDSDDWEYLAGYTEVIMKRNTDDFCFEIYSAFKENRECKAANPPPPDVSWPISDWCKEEPTSFKQMVFEWCSKI
jgi:hypothetical protein